MSTLHEKLLTASGPLPPGAVLSDSNVNSPRAALRAVVELHAPEAVTRGVFCSTCWDSRWPCSTIQAIARELGVDGGG